MALSFLEFTLTVKDVRTAVDDIHLRSLDLKKAVISNMPDYVKRDPRLGPMLEGVRQSGRKLFLLTNSDWWYTNNIMTFLLGGQSVSVVNITYIVDSSLNWELRRSVRLVTVRYFLGEWRACFDCVIVDACKPKYFSGGTPLHIVSPQSGEVRLAPPLSNLPAGGDDVILSGGDAASLTRMLGLPGRNILYCGDHLYADVIKCRQLSPWRTLLVIPELARELTAARLTSGLLEQLARLESLLASNPKLTELKRRLHEAVAEFDRSFCQTGSLFRSGVRLSYFGAMVHAWAELYTGSVNNILGYSLDHR